MLKLFSPSGDGVMAHSSLGLWLDSRVPPTGWKCHAIKDAGDEGVVCGMCQSATVRFTHLMTHPQVPEVLSVGAPCAERMEDDYYTALKRERVFRDDIRIIRGWPQRQWKQSQLGNHYVNARGFNITIWNKGGAGFGITIKLQNKFDRKFELNGKKLFKTVEEAKGEALTALLYARRRLREGLI
ncbi:hypothetical protein GCM10007919_39750 [Rhizobium indigoferae]|nr:hypothetical protein GCM10007919_39750 [Rhizobium indigoferae]